METIDRNTTATGVPSYEKRVLDYTGGRTIIDTN
jgi:hypothetical protein